MRNTDFVRENITLLLGDFQIAQIVTFSSYFMLVYNFFEKFPDISHVLQHSECIYIPLW